MTDGFCDGSGEKWGSAVAWGQTAPEASDLLVAWYPKQAASGKQCNVGFGVKLAVQLAAACQACIYQLARLPAGRTYRPNVVRVGSEVGGAVNPAVRDRLVGLMVDRYKTMSQSDWQHRWGVVFGWAGRAVRATWQGGVVALEGSCWVGGSSSVASCEDQLWRQVWTLNPQRLSDSASNT